MQGRNERCACGSGVKYKNCCGRFSVHELTGRLTEFATNNRRKDKLVSHAVKMLAASPENEVALLCLVNPKPTEEGFFEWTVLGKDNPADEVEAVVTRRVLAGYLPVGCIQEKARVGIINEALVPEEIRAEYVAFSQMQMPLIAATINGKMDKNDSKLLPVDWDDRTYPGQPRKQRKPGIIRVEVDIERRVVRIVVERLHSYLDAPIADDMIEGNAEEDALYVAAHVIEAMEQAGSPNGAVPGDVFEILLMQAEGAPRLLARKDCALAPSGLTGRIGMGGVA